MIRSRSHQITFLITPLEFILSALKYIFIPASFLLLALKIINIPDFLETKFSISSGIWEIGLVVIAASMLYLPKAINAVNSTFLWIKRKLVLLCEGGYPQFRRKSPHPFCIISKYRFPYPTFNHKSQTEVERDILASLKRNRKDGKSLLYFISGESGTGKSTLAFFICYSIVVERVYKYMDRIYFYDFGRSRACQNNFIVDSRALKHEEAVVIIDNFQDILPENLGSITKYLLDICQKGLPGCIIILSQPLDKLSVNPGDDIRLFTEIKRNYSFLELNQIDLKSIPIPSDNRVWRMLRKRKIINPELPNHSLVCLHISRLFSNVLGCEIQIKQKDFLEKLKPEKSEGIEENKADSMNLLGIICALSIHRGGFTPQEFRNACFSNSSKFIVKNTFNWLKYRISLWRLARSGFVETRSLQGKRFIFHDALAQHYKDLFFIQSSFRISFITTVENLCQKLIASGNDQLLGWLYASEIGREAWIAELFDKAMMKGNFNRMLLALKRNKNLFNGKLQWDHQMGILFEKIGFFHESCSHLRRVINQNLNTLGKEERSRAIIALIEAEHGKDAIDRLVQLEDSSEKMIKLGASYWIQHIRCHFGDFNLAKLSGLADSFMEHLSRRPFLKQSYFAIHLARRIYFDLFRYFYLLGHNDFQKLVKIRDHGLGKFLSKTHVEFEAFFLKFYQAHYIHYIILFELGIFKNKPRAYDKNLIPKSYLNDIHASEFADLAIKYYQQSIDAFEVFGDKTIEYILPRIMELEMLKENPNMDDTLIQLNAFAKFIYETGFRDLKAYPHLFLFKFNYLRSFQVLHNIGHYDSKKSTSQVLWDSDYYRKIARNDLERAIEIHRTENNSFGILRGGLLLALTDLVASQDYEHFQKSLLDLREKGASYGYKRELRIIEKCLRDEKMGLQEVLDIIKFYPIVLQ